MILFRCGSNLYVGESNGSKVHLMYNYVGRGTCRPIPEVEIGVHESCIISESFEPKDIIECERFMAFSLSMNLHRDLKRLMACSRELPESIIAFDDQITEATFSNAPHEWVGIHEVASRPDVMAALNMEAMRRPLIERGWITPDAMRNFGNSFIAYNPVWAYMRENPFKDVTKLESGLDIGIAGYQRGCVLLEADGEEFWHPIDEAFFDAPEYKDDHYYFTLDGNRNKIPDPIEMLPSKMALDGRPSSRRDNWNQQPYLPRVAGNFSATPEINNPDTGIPQPTVEHPDPAGDMIDQFVATKNYDAVFGPREQGQEFRPEDSRGNRRYKGDDRAKRSAGDGNGLRL